MRFTLSDRGTNALANSLRGVFALPAQLNFQRLQAENNQLMNESAVRKALSTVALNNSAIALNQQKYGGTQQVLDSFAGADMTDQGNRNAMISAVNGRTYMPFQNIGNTGQVFDQATGAVSDNNNGLSRVYEKVQNSISNRNNAAAAASMATKNLRDTQARAGGFAPKSTSTAMPKAAWTVADMIGDGQDWNGKPTVSPQRFNEANKWSLETKGVPLNVNTAMDYYEVISNPPAPQDTNTTQAPTEEQGYLSKFINGVTSLISSPETVGGLARASGAQPITPISQYIRGVIPAAGAAPAPEIQTGADYMTKEQVKDLYRNGKITREQAIEIANKYGW
jgi:hypothetical protein